MGHLDQPFAMHETLAHDEGGGEKAEGGEECREVVSCVHGVAFAHRNFQQV